MFLGGIGGGCLGALIESWGGIGFLGNGGSSFLILPGSIVVASRLFEI